MRARWLLWLTPAALGCCWWALDRHPLDRLIRWLQMEG